MTPFAARFVTLLAAAVWVLYASGTLQDTPLVLAAAAAPRAPVLETSVTDRSAEVRVEVVDENGAVVPGARVTVYLLRDEVAYLAGAFVTDAAGVAEARRLPRGESFLLAESPGRQRASSRLVATATRGHCRLVLRRAQVLAVQVIDEEARALVGAEVTVSSGDPLPYVGRSQKGGLAQVGRLGPPPWTVRATKPGYEPAERSGVSPGLVPLRLALRALSSLEVSVVMPGGEPARGATVMLAGSGLWPARKSTADELGKVRVGALPAGAYDVVAMLGDLISKTSLATPVKRGEARALRLELLAGRQVAIEVREGEGSLARPVAGASVVLAEDGLTSFPREGVTGSDGRVTLGPVSTRAATVSARAEGFVSATGVRVAPSGGDAAAQAGGGLAAGAAGQAGEPLVLSLVRGAVLTGRVVDGHDVPVDGASIEVIGVDGAGMPIDETPEHSGFQAAHFSWALRGPAELLPAGELGVMAGPLPPIPHGNGGPVVPGAAPRPGSDERPADPWVSRADGTFRASPIPPGRVRALVRHPGYVEGLSPLVALAPGASAEVRVVLREGGTLEGRVVDGTGRAVAGARVEIAATHGTLVRGAVTADDGTFGFAAVPAEVSVSVWRPGEFDAAALRRSVSLDEGQRRELTLTLPEPRGPVTIRVIDDRGFALESAQISALSLSVDAPLRATRFTRDDGVASLPDAAGLPLRLEVSLSGHAPVLKILERAEPELSVTLPRGSLLGGEVTAHAGHDSVDGAEVTLHLPGGLRRTRTGEGGRYSFRDLAPGPARLVVRRKGYVRQERAITIPEPDGDRTASLEPVDLLEGGAVEGEVLDAEGNPVAGARVAEGSVPAYLPLGPLPPGIVVTDAEGRFSLGDLAEGAVDLEAYAPDKGRGRVRSVRVTAGETAREIRIRLDTPVTDPEPASSGGVAVTLGEAGPRGARRVVLLAVAVGSEAERAGLQAGDEIAQIDETPPASLEDARRRLSGPASDDVVLRLVRDAQVLVVRLARERVRR